MTEPIHSGDPREQLLIEQALFKHVEENEATEALRLWESPRPAVIAGALGAVNVQVHETQCAAANVPVLRRCSGGGAVVIGPGCINYSFILSMEDRPELRDVANSYGLILSPIVHSLGLPELNIRGSDLAMNDRKVSGNSQRRGRRALLHHGTILYNFDIGLMSLFLKNPVRKPAYRGCRDHLAFVTNMPLTRKIIELSLQRAWMAILKR
jgi:lipoate-protein ligase A